MTNRVIESKAWMWHRAIEDIEARYRNMQARREEVAKDLLTLETNCFMQGNEVCLSAIDTVNLKRAAITREQEAATRRNHHDCFLKELPPQLYRRDWRLIGMTRELRMAQDYLKCYEKHMNGLIKSAYDEGMMLTKATKEIKAALGNTKN